MEISLGKKITVPGPSVDADGNKFPVDITFVVGGFSSTPGGSGKVRERLGKFTVADESVTYVHGTIHEPPEFAENQVSFKESDLK